MSLFFLSSRSSASSICPFSDVDVRFISFMKTGLRMRGDAPRARRENTGFSGDDERMPCPRPIPGEPCTAADFFVRISTSVSCILASTAFVSSPSSMPFPIFLKGDCWGGGGKAEVRREPGTCSKSGEGAFIADFRRSIMAFVKCFSSINNA